MKEKLNIFMTPRETRNHILFPHQIGTFAKPSQDSINEYSVKMTMSTDKNPFQERNPQQSLYSHQSNSAYMQKKRKCRKGGKSRILKHKSKSSTKRGNNSSFNDKVIEYLQRELNGSTLVF